MFLVFKFLIYVLDFIIFLNIRAQGINLQQYINETKSGLILVLSYGFQYLTRG